MVLLKFSSNSVILIKLKLLIVCLKILGALFNFILGDIFWHLINIENDLVFKNEVLSLSSLGLLRIDIFKNIIIAALTLILVLESTQEFGSLKLCECVMPNLPIGDNVERNRLNKISASKAVKFRECWPLFIHFLELN